MNRFYYAQGLGQGGPQLTFAHLGPLRRKLSDAKQDGLSLKQDQHFQKVCVFATDKEDAVLILKWEEEGAEHIT